jgi:hypothetical protein
MMKLQDWNVGTNLKRMILETNKFHAVLATGI